MVPSPTLPRHRTWTWMTRHSASCSPSHTEDKLITAVRKACLSVSRHCMSRSIERSTLTVQEVGSLEHRGTASSNANKFNLAIDEENIDFNIPRVPNSMVKRSHAVNGHYLIQKIENHPQRQALQRDLQQHRRFNPFSKESQDVMKAAGNTELCKILDFESKAQCKACLTYWDVGIVYCTCGHFLRDDTTQNKKYIKSVLDLFSKTRTFTSGKVDHTVTDTERRCSRMSYCESTPKEV